MDFFSTNSFDLAIYICLFVAVVMGFMTGMLRSLATIFGYVCGMGVALAVAPKLTPMLTTYLKMPTPQTWIVFVALFVAAGAAISALLRLAVSEMGGGDVPANGICRQLTGKIPPALNFHASALNDPNRVSRCAIRAGVGKAASYVVQAPVRPYCQRFRVDPGRRPRGRARIAPLQRQYARAESRAQRACHSCNERSTDGRGDT